MMRSPRSKAARGEDTVRHQKSPKAKGKLHHHKHKRRNNYTARPSPRKRHQRSPATNDSPDSIATAATSCSSAETLQPASLFQTTQNALYELLQRHDTRLLQHEISLRSALNETMEFRAEIGRWLVQETVLSAKTADPPRNRDSPAKRQLAPVEASSKPEPMAVHTTTQEQPPPIHTTSNEETASTQASYCRPTETSRKDRRTSKARRFLASLSQRKKKLLAPKITPMATDQDRSLAVALERPSNGAETHASSLADVETITPVVPDKDRSAADGGVKERPDNCVDSRAHTLADFDTRIQDEDEVSHASSHTMDDEAFRGSMVSKAQHEDVRSRSQDGTDEDSLQRCPKTTASIPTAIMDRQAVLPGRNEATKQQKSDLLPGWLSNASSKRFMEEMDEASRRIPAGRPVGNWKSTRSERRVPTTPNDEPGYAYQETVRCKESRAGLPCQDCYQCQRFYKVLQDTGHDIVVEDAGRHRNRFARSETPEDFWELDFIDELKEKRKQTNKHG